jgi:hypothetical protein
MNSHFLKYFNFSKKRVVAAAKTFYQKKELVKKITGDDLKANLKYFYMISLRTDFSNSNSDLGGKVLHQNLCFTRKSVGKEN